MGVWQICEWRSVREMLPGLPVTHLPIPQLRGRSLLWVHTQLQSCYCESWVLWNRQAAWGTAMQNSGLACLASWPWGAPWPLNPLVTSQSTEISVYRWEDEVSLYLGWKQWQARRESPSPTEGCQQIVPLGCWPHQLLWSAEVSGHLIWESGLLRLWLAFGFCGGFFLLSTYPGLGRADSRLAQRGRQLLRWTNNSERHYLNTWYESNTALRALHVYPF